MKKNTDYAMKNEKEETVILESGSKGTNKKMLQAYTEKFKK